MNRDQLIAQLKQGRKTLPVSIPGLDGAYVRMLTIGERERLDAILVKASEESRTYTTALSFGLCDASGEPFVEEGDFAALDAIDFDAAKAAGDAFLKLNKMRKEDAEAAEKN